MTGDCHVRFGERLGGRFPRPTQLDFVQIQPGPIGPILDRLHQRLGPLLGNPIRKQKQGNVVLSYRFPSEIPPIAPLRLKVEINTREHFTVFGLEEHLFTLESQWKTKTCKTTTYCLDELLGTKLRALYQRRTTINSGQMKHSDAKHINEFLLALYLSKNGGPTLPVKSTRTIFH